VNLGAFYLVGIPVGAVLGFVADYRAKGLWIGIVAGSILQSFLLSLITALTNWKKQVHISPYPIMLFLLHCRNTCF